jgi:hypothetical protein
MYGSIFTAVIFKPRPFNNLPMEDAVIPFPKPDNTPPVTIMYFIIPRAWDMASLVFKGLDELSETFYYFRESS